MLKVTNQIFEPIRMSREEGTLSRSTTTRAPATALGRRKGGPLNRLSRDIKGGIANGSGHVDLEQATGHGQANGTPAINVTVEPSQDNTAQDGGSGVGVGSSTESAPGAGGPKGQRHRLGPSANRFAFARGVSAPELFTEVPAFKKKAAAAAAANGTEGNGAETTDGQNQEGTQNQNLGLLNTTGLKHPAGGDKGSRSPLRQSIMPSTTEEEEGEDAEEAEEAEEKAASASDDVIETPTSQGEQNTHVELESVQDEDTSATSVSDTSSVTVTVTEAGQDEATEWKAVSGMEFESSGRKLERRRKNRQSALSNQSDGADGSELSAESVLQALQNEDSK